MAKRVRYDDYAAGSRRRRNFMPLFFTLIIVGLMAVLGYWYFNPQSAPTWARGYIPEAPTQLYKWQDEKGKVKYSSTPPAAGVAYEKVDYWENANVIPTLRENE